MAGPIHFRWLGVAGIELTASGSTLLIDPCFTRPPWWRLAFGRVIPDAGRVAEQIHAGDYVLVSHSHWDHVMDVPEVVRRTGAVALGSPNTCRLLAACGVPMRQLREIGVGERLALGVFRVEVLPAQHRRLPGFGPGHLSSRLRPPLRLRDYRMDCYFSFLVEVDGLRLLDWRGVCPTPAVPADVLCLEPAGSHAYYQILLRQVCPRLVVPVHWDDLFQPLSRPVRPFIQAPHWGWPPLRQLSLAEFEHTIADIAPGTQVLVAEMFHAYALTEIMREYAT